MLLMVTKDQIMNVVSNPIVKYSIMVVGWLIVSITIYKLYNPSAKSTKIKIMNCRKIVNNFKRVNDAAGKSIW